MTTQACENMLSALTTTPGCALPAVVVVILAGCSLNAKASLKTWTRHVYCCMM
jgi:hypothetical protein